MALRMQWPPLRVSFNNTHAVNCGSWPTHSKAQHAAQHLGGGGVKLGEKGVKCSVGWDEERYAALHCWHHVLQQSMRNVQQSVHVNK